MAILGVVAFVLGLLVSVLLHEAGHLVTAKRFGMKATEYFVGFGPRLWSFRRGETEYGVKAIPAGGYVKIIGMAPEEEVAEQDRPRAFYSKPGWQRAIVLVAGSGVHFLIAFVLLFVMAGALGVPTRPPTVGEVIPCVPQNPTSACSENRPPSPAAQAGLKPDDRIVAVSGQRVDSWEQLATTLGRQGEGPVTLTVLRDGRRATLRVDLASLGKGGFLGIRPESRVVLDRQGPVDAVQYAAQMFGTIVVKTAQIFAALPAVVPDLFSPDRGEATPGPGGVASVVGVAQFSGAAFTGPQSWAVKLLLFFSLMVSVNISVGMLNLLPLMPLDGGRLAVLGYERAKAGVYHLRGLGEPRPVDMTKLLPVTALALVIILGFGVLLILADILNPALSVS